MRATGCGTPRCPSAQLRIFGPSASRNRRLSAVIARKKTSEESVSSAEPTPSSSAETELLTPESAEFLASDAVEGSTPTSVSHPAIVSLASAR